jgi:WD40 repeat protein
LSPDGKYVVSASADGTVRLWDIETGQEVRRFSDHAGVVNSVAFSSDSKRVLTGGTDGIALLWNIEPHLEHPTFDGENDMYAVAFSADGKRMATNVINNELRLWNVSTGQMLWKTQDSGLALWALDYSPDGRYLVSGNMDGVATLWDAQTGSRVRQFAAEGLDEIYALDFSPDGKSIVAGGSFRQDKAFVLVWDVETGREVFRIPPSYIYTASFSPDGAYILTGGAEGVSRLWDAQTGKKLKEFTGNLAIFSPNGKNVATIGGPSGWAGSTVFIWDIQTGKEINHFEGPTDGIFGLTYTPDGKTIAAVGSANSVYLWNSQTGQELRRYPQAAPVDWITFSPDSQFVVSVSTDGLARFFDVDYRTTMKYLCSILLRDFTDDERAQYGISDPAPTCPKP